MDEEQKARAGRTRALEGARSGTLVGSAFVHQRRGHGRRDHYRMAGDRAERYTFGERAPERPHTIVAVEGPAICGFATTGPSRDDPTRSGELYALNAATRSTARRQNSGVIERAGPRNHHISTLEGALGAPDHLAQNPARERIQDMFNAQSTRAIRPTGALRWQGRRQLVALALALAALGIAPAASQATAVGYQYWAPVSFHGIQIPGGQLTHIINGKGLHVNWDGANFVSGGNLCDSSMKFTYGGGKLQWTGSPAHSNVHRGCSHVGQWKYWWNGWKAPRGKACAELWSENWKHYVTKQCHYIH
jgi:hypothetical protein